MLLWSGQPDIGVGVGVEEDVRLGLGDGLQCLSVPWVLGQGPVDNVAGAEFVVSTRKTSNTAATTKTLFTKLSLLPILLTVFPSFDEAQGLVYGPKRYI